MAKKSINSIYFSQRPDIDSAPKKSKRRYRMLEKLYNKILDTKFELIADDEGRLLLESLDLLNNSEITLRELRNKFPTYFLSLFNTFVHLGIVDDDLLDNSITSGLNTYLCWRDEEYVRNIKEKMTEKYSGESYRLEMKLRGKQLWDKYKDSIMESRRKFYESEDFEEYRGKLKSYNYDKWIPNDDPELDFMCQLYNKMGFSQVRKFIWKNINKDFFKTYGVRHSRRHSAYFLKRFGDELIDIVTNYDGDVIESLDDLLDFNLICSVIKNVTYEGCSINADDDFLKSCVKGNYLYYSIHKDYRSKAPKDLIIDSINKLIHDMSYYNSKDLVMCSRFKRFNRRFIPHYNHIIKMVQAKQLLNELKLSLGEVSERELMLHFLRRLDDINFIAPGRDINDAFKKSVESIILGIIEAEGVNYVVAREQYFNRVLSLDYDNPDWVANYRPSYNKLLRFLKSGYYNLNDLLLNDVESFTDAYQFIYDNINPRVLKKYGYRATNDFVRCLLSRHESFNHSLIDSYKGDILTDWQGVINLRVLETSKSMGKDKEFLLNDIKKNIESFSTGEFSNPKSIVKQALTELYDNIRVMNMDNPIWKNYYRKYYRKIHWQLVKVIEDYRIKEGFESVLSSDDWTAEPVKSVNNLMLYYLRSNDDLSLLIPEFNRTKRLNQFNELVLKHSNNKPHLYQSGLKKVYDKLVNPDYNDEEWLNCLKLPYDKLFKVIKSLDEFKL